MITVFKKFQSVDKHYKKAFRGQTIEFDVLTIWGLAILDLEVDKVVEELIESVCVQLALWAKSKH